MTLTDLLGLFGGLALFLYGMQMMSDGLEDAAGNRMKQILERLTSNRFLGVAVGAGITAVIQSSSATTVMVVGFVNSGMMTLNQAVWIIMGANVGTTVTSQLIALDVGLLAPLMAFVGVSMIVFFKNPKAHHLGKIFAGLGILFIGMDMMREAMRPLENTPGFVSLMTSFSNPFVGVAVGALFTAVIQSSSASVGILQALAASGLIPFSSAVYVLFGQNIGTCITALIASMGTNRAAKRTTLIHLMFNVVGTAIFMIICMSFPLADYVARLTPGLPETQIANMHTIFNIVTTLLLLPFGTLMAKLATIILPDIPLPDLSTTSLGSITEEFRRSRTTLGSTAVHLDLLAHEISRMLTLAAENVNRSFNVVLNADLEELKVLEEAEEKLDNMNKEISQYISNILVHNNSNRNVSDIKEYFTITGNAERIGDHASNIGGYAQMIKRRSIVFSEMARAELRQMQAITGKAMEKVMTRDGDSSEWLARVAAMEQEIDDMTERYRDKHLERMLRGECSEEACILYSELLTDFERVGDHVLNIAQAFAKMSPEF